MGAGGFPTRQGQRQSRLLHAASRGVDLPCVQMCREKVGMSSGNASPWDMQPPDGNTWASCCFSRVPKKKVEQGKGKHTAGSTRLHGGFPIWHKNTCISCKGSSRAGHGAGRAGMNGHHHPWPGWRRQELLAVRPQPKLKGGSCFTFLFA